MNRKLVKEENWKRVVLAQRRIYHRKIWSRFQEYMIENPDTFKDAAFEYREKVALASLRALKLISKICARS